MTGAAGFWEETRGAIRATPGFGALVSMNLLGSFVAGLVIPILPLFLLSKGFSLLQMGGLFSLVAAAALVVQLLSGRYPEAFGRPGVVLVLSLVQAAQFVAYAFVETPLEFLALSAIGACAGAAAAPGTQALLAEAAPIRVRARVFSLFGMLSGLGYAAAVVVAYALADVSFKAVFLLGATAAVTMTFVLVGLRLRTVRLAPPAALLLPGERDASRELERASARVARAWLTLQRARLRLERTLPREPGADRNLRLCASHIFLFGFALAIYPVYFPLYLLGHGLSPAWMGVAIASSWVAFAVVQPLGVHVAERVGVRRLVVGAVCVAAALNVVMAMLPLPFILAAWVALGAADGLARPVISAAIGQQSARAGRVASYAWTQGAGAAARILAPYTLALAIGGRGVALGLLLVGGVVLLSAFPLAFLVASDRAPRPVAATAPPPAAGDAP